MTDNSGPFSPGAQVLVDVLKPHTPFAEAIVRRQCERAGVSSDKLAEHDIEKVLPLIIAAASTFVEPSIIAHLRRVCDAMKK